MLKRGTVRVGEIEFVQHIDISPQVAAGITERQRQKERNRRKAFSFEKQIILYILKVFCDFTTRCGGGGMGVLLKEHKQENK